MRLKSTFLTLFLLAGFCLVLLQAGHAEAPKFAFENNENPNSQEITGTTAPTTVSVLWDLSHGVHQNYRPDYGGAYWDFRNHLRDNGYIIETTYDILHKNILSYDILVINVASSWYSDYTWNEKEKIRKYVEHGGKLLILGGNPWAPNAHIHHVSQEFGITFGVSGVNGYVNSFASHQIFNGVTNIYFQSGGQISINPPGQQVAWRSGKCTVGVAYKGTGVVVAVGDFYFCSNNYLNWVNNRKFAENLFYWLHTGGGGGGTVDGLFDFNDGTLQGWTLVGAYDEWLRGPFPHNFRLLWDDRTNYPNRPFWDPWGDKKGSARMYTSTGHGVNSPYWHNWWVMRYLSPDLTASTVWQSSAGFTVELCNAMSDAIYANLLVVVYDHDQHKERTFYSGSALLMQHHTHRWWNHLEFKWADISGFPNNYTVKRVMVQIWGRKSSYYTGSIYIDNVTPLEWTGEPTWIRVTYPNGGEVWYVNHDYTITWETDKKVGKVLVEISTTGGQSWWDVTQQKLTPNDGAYTYRVVWQNVSENCYFRVRTQSLRVWDVSDHRFAIRWENGASEGASDVAHTGQMAIPTEFKMLQNYPNPFNPETTIEYQLPEATDVVLSIFDLNGKEIRKLINESRSAGYHKVKWDGRDAAGLPVASGFYFYRIQAGNHTETQKCLLLK